MVRISPRCFLRLDCSFSWLLFLGGDAPPSPLETLTILRLLGCALRRFGLRWQRAKRGFHLPRVKFAARLVAVSMNQVAPRGRIRRGARTRRWFSVAVVLLPSRCCGSKGSFCCHRIAMAVRVGIGGKGLRQGRFSGAGPTGPTGHDWPSPPVLQALRPERLGGYALSNRHLGCALRRFGLRWQRAKRGFHLPRVKFAARLVAVSMNQVAPRGRIRRGARTRRWFSVAVVLLPSRCCGSKGSFCCHRIAMAVRVGIGGKGEREEGKAGYSQASSVYTIW